MREHEGGEGGVELQVVVRPRSKASCLLAWAAPRESGEQRATKPLLRPCNQLSADTSGAPRYRVGSHATTKKSD